MSGYKPDLFTGATLGAGVGSAGANVQKVIKGKNLKQYGDIDLLDKKTYFYNTLYIY